jgi:hypothetical protein
MSVSPAVQPTAEWLIPLFPLPQNVPIALEMEPIARKNYTHCHYRWLIANMVAPLFFSPYSHAFTPVSKCPNWVRKWIKRKEREKL